ncbi:MAG TPA: crossover junction endodeoxyribonuclease RuvC [bacterium]|jgi:Holliday junction resolvasome RuvABC endonuclease subunit|nr:crossover junction endodeoxyribonuclease RuvC [bacterium]
MENKYVYGLDLSLNSSGICIFSNDGKIIELLTIDTHKEKEIPAKLKIIGNDLIKISKVYPPSKIVIEQGFSRYNASTQAIFRVHGIVNYLFNEYEQIYYPASSIKKVVTGKGNASKKEVQDAILLLFPKLKFANTDESDACAVGLTYFIKNGVIKNA